MSILDIFENIQQEERTVNYKQVVQNIAGDYGYPHSPLSERISHGIQKDAIQNGWDASLKKTINYIQNNWSFVFELKEVLGNTLLTMTDLGTTGITGNLTAVDLKNKNIAAEDLPKIERWARWESLGYTKAEGLGARGQGKMIFMLGSKDYTIFYDSLRDDGSYRFGGSYATGTGCPVIHLDHDDAKKAIKNKLGLSPISNQGTRIIIFNPVEELLEDIENGNLLKFIEETWWPNILKFEAKISIINNADVVTARVPKYFPITDDLKETTTFKTWIKKNEDFRKTGLRIKRLCAACDKRTEVNELTEGISCFRDGMKVDLIRFPIKSYRSKVYGYVEFEPELEEQLRQNEKPTHYAFKGTTWNKIKNLVEQELESFANKKLGFGIDSQEAKNAKRNSAESKALSILRAVTRNWSLSKSNVGGGGGNGTESSDKEIGVRLSELAFPNPGNLPRLDFGQQTSDFKIVAYNKTDDHLKVNLNAFVLSGDTKILELRNESLELKPKSTTQFSHNQVKADKASFKTAGIYRIRIHLIDSENNIRLDEITRRIWVETDPELAGPFDVRRRKFSELPEKLNINKSKEWILSPEGDNKYTFYYNQDHPAYFFNDGTENDLVGYLAEIFSMGALELFIRQASITNEKPLKELPIKLDILRSASPIESYNEYVLAQSKLREKIYGIIK